MKETGLICAEVGGQRVPGSPEQAQKEAALRENTNLSRPADSKCIMGSELRATNDLTRWCGAM